MATPNINWLLPLQRGDYGFYAANTDIEDATKQNIRTVLMTRKNERVVRTEYGTDIVNMLFANKSPELRMEMHAEIINAIARWVPNVRVNRVNVIFKEDTGIGSRYYGKLDLDENSVYVTIEYSITNRQGSFSVPDKISLKLNAVQ